MTFSDVNLITRHAPGDSNMADYYLRHPVTSGPCQFLKKAKEAAELEYYVNMVVKSVKPRALSKKQLQSKVVLENLFAEVPKVYRTDNRAQDR